MLEKNNQKKNEQSLKDDIASFDKRNLIILKNKLSMLKKRFIISLWSSFVILLLGVTVFYTYKSKRLKGIVNSQNDLINKLSLDNTMSLDTTRRYVDSVKQYIEFNFKGKNLSSDDFIKVFQKIDLENEKRKDSIRFYKSQINVATHNETIYRNNIKYLKDVISSYQKQDIEVQKKLENLNKELKQAFPSDTTH